MGLLTAKFLSKIETDFERVYLFWVLHIFSSRIVKFVHFLLDNNTRKLLINRNRSIKCKTNTFLIYSCLIMENFQNISIKN